MSRLNLSSAPTKHSPLISSSSKSVIKKKYSIISNDLRQKFIDRINSNKVTIKKVGLIKLIILIFFLQAADEFGLRFSTAKSILHIFRKEGRIGKKKTRKVNKPQECCNNKTWFSPKLDRLPKIQVRLFSCFKDFTTKVQHEMILNNFG